VLSTFQKPNNESVPRDGRQIFHISLTTVFSAGASIGHEACLQPRRVRPTMLRARE